MRSVCVCTRECACAYHRPGGLCVAASFLGFRREDFKKALRVRLPTRPCSLHSGFFFEPLNATTDASCAERQTAPPPLGPPRRRRWHMTTTEPLTAASRTGVGTREYGVFRVFFFFSGARDASHLLVLFCLFLFVLPSESGREKKNKNLHVSLFCHLARGNELWKLNN